MSVPKKLAPGFIVFRGPQGVGKTSLAVAMLCNDYKYHNATRTSDARAFAYDYKRANNGKTLTIARHLYFTNIKVTLDPRRKIYTHYTDTQRLALPNLLHTVQHFPPHSVVFIQEADTQLFNRLYKDTSKYLIDLLKYVRHNGMTIIFDTQQDSALDKAVRRLAMQVYHVLEQSAVKFLWFELGRRWSFLIINNFLNDAVKDLASIGVHVKLNVVTKGSYRYRGNVFDRYDSYSGQAYFLRYLDDYTFPEHPKESLAQADIEAYCAAHPLTSS